MGVLCVTLIVGAASVAVAGIPDLELSTSTRAYTGEETLSLWNLPDGTGNPFAEAFLPGGANADATITVVLKDGNGDFVTNYVFEDITLSCNNGLPVGDPDRMAMVPCDGGATSDGDTDENGETEFATPLNAGGWSETNTVVLIAGAPLASADVALWMNSSDLSGDGDVNLTDVGMFSPYYYGAYGYAADFNFDGEVDLSDVGRLAAGYGGACPELTE